MISLMIVGGPVQELVNVGIMFVLITVFRVILSYLTIICAECLSPKALTSAQRKRVASDLWYATYYVIAAFTGTYLLFARLGWSDQSRVCSWEDAEAVLSTDKLLYAYHCMQVAFYVNYVFAMFSGIDPPHKDYSYVVHHIITLVLIVFSRNAGYMRIQLGVLVVHDIADPFLHVAKLIKFLRPAARKVYQPIFVAFALVFFATRLYVFPMFLIDNCRLTWNRMHPDDWAYIASPVASPDIIPPAPFSITSSHITVCWFRFSFYGMGVMLLYSLLALHAFWGLKIIQAIFKQVDKTMDGNPKQQQQLSNDQKSKTE